MAILLVFFEELLQDDRETVVDVVIYFVYFSLKIINYIFARLKEKTLGLNVASSIDAAYYALDASLLS
jgi:hypothetical protein